MKLPTKRMGFLMAAVVGALLGPGFGTALASGTTCETLNMVWHDPSSGAVIRSEPYECGADLCAGYRCKEGNEISPACYNAAECPDACAGECVSIPTAQLDCGTTCSSAGCGVTMIWYKRGKLLREEPYECEADACAGYRCLDGSEISPACYTASQCSKSCKTGTCVSVPSLQGAGDCDGDLCSMVDDGSGS